MKHTTPQNEWVVAIEVASNTASQPLLFADYAAAQAETLEITEDELSDYYGARRPAGFYDYAADIHATQWAFEEYDKDMHDLQAITACGHNFTKQEG